MEDRIIAAGYRDMGIAEDMATSLTTSRDYTGEIDVGFPPDLVNPNEADILMQITVLTDLLMIVRGNPFKQDGSRSTLAEYGMTEPPEKRRRKPIQKP